MMRRTIAGRIPDSTAPEAGTQDPAGFVLPLSGAPGIVSSGQCPSAFFPSFVVFSARADAAAIARLEGVTVCEGGQRVFGATGPRCGSGLVLARAGKALAARGASVQSGWRAALAGLPSCASAPGGSTASTAAHSTGFFIPASVERFILAISSPARRRDS
jgi:hypothetical protein